MHAAEEAIDIFKVDGLNLNSMRIKSFPFCEEVKNFIDQHENVFVIEQNKDAQMRSLLINELEIIPSKLKKVLHYDGTPITANIIVTKIHSAIFQSTN
jgi:2-oxoglutarate ferredoxin oxidoreductase subunit alpha